MTTIYIQGLDGEIITCSLNTNIKFLRNGMVQVETPSMIYITSREHVEIIADTVEELWE